MVNSISNPPRLLSLLRLTLSPLHTLISTMPSPSLSSSVVSVDSGGDGDTNFGFERSDMYKDSLSGTVDLYHRHIFLFYGKFNTWPSKFHVSDNFPLPKALSSGIKSRKDDIPLKTRMTVCEGLDRSDGDVLIFPEMIKCRGLNESDVDDFIEDVLVNGKPWSSGVQEVLGGTHVFVCAHGSRDKRCGVCGPALIEKFKEEINSRGLNDQVFVSGCSHVGGHKYAGNLIIFSADTEGKIAGHWYGYVTPDDVAAFLDQHITKGEIIEPLWRGQMGGVPVEKAEKVDKKKVSNGTHVEEIEKPNGDIKNAKEQIATSCCQGVNGVSCCRDAIPESKETTKERKKKESSKLSCLMGKWEQNKVYTAVGIVGAVATIAVAYSFYKRSR